MRTRVFALLACLLAPWVASPAAAKPAQGPAAKKTTAPTTQAASSAKLKQSPAKPPARKPTVASKSSKKKPAPPPCFAKPVRFMRQRSGGVEHITISLTYCDGRANPAALDELSLLARSRDVDMPSASELKSYALRPIDRGPKSARRDPLYVSPKVMRLHPDLLLRLQKIADRFPDRLIDIVSGHRPEARFTSRHHHGRALDLRVDGVSRERVRDFARTLEGTGVGYYPNSVFTHVDVREDKGYWVDRSGPGEKADYGTWPPRPREIDEVRETVIANARAALGELALAPLDGGGHGPAPLREERAPYTSSTNVDRAALAARAFERAAMPLPPPPSPVEGPVRAPSAAKTAPPSAAKAAPPSAPRGRTEADDDESERPLRADEVERIRSDALKALARLR